MLLATSILALHLLAPSLLPSDEHTLKYAPAVGRVVEGVTEVETSVMLNNRVVSVTTMSTCARITCLRNQAPVQIQLQRFTIMQPLRCGESSKGLCSPDTIEARLRRSRIDTVTIDRSPNASLASKNSKPTPFGQYRTMAFVPPTSPVSVLGTWTYDDAETTVDSSHKFTAYDSVHITYRLDRIHDSSGVRYAEVSATVEQVISGAVALGTTTHRGKGKVFYTIEVESGILVRASGNILLNGDVAAKGGRRMSTDISESFTYFALDRD